MSYLLRAKTCGRDNIAVGSAKGREMIVNGSSQPASTTQYSKSNIAVGSALLPENFLSVADTGSSSSPTIELPAV